MSRYSSGGVTSAGSTTLPAAALVGAAGARLKIVEIGVFNTTSTAVALVLARLSTAGTPGSTLDGADNNTDPGSTGTPVGILKGTYTSTPPTTAKIGFRAQLGASVGAGFAWTFGAGGLIVPAAAAAGIGILVDTGTGQALETYFVWDE